MNTHRSALSHFVLGACAALLACAAPSFAQANFLETFDTNGTTNPGQLGPSNLVARGWIFRNQSAPRGPGAWFDGYTSFGWPEPQSGAGYLAVNSTVASNGRVSAWAILPAVAGQQAGDALTFFAMDLAETGDEPNTFQVRYAPSGGTGTGTGPNDVGDFTQLLLDINPIPVGGGWNRYSVNLPGAGRIALRYYMDYECTFVGCYVTYSGIDTLSVGPPPPPSCPNLPPIPTDGQTVVWTAAGSPYRICENISIPSNATVIVEPGVRVDIDPQRQLFVAGTLNAQGTAQSGVTFSTPLVFPPMIEALNGTINASFTTFESGQVRVESGATILLTDCAFPEESVLLAQELQQTAPYIRLTRCAFTAAQVSLSDAIVVLEDNTFTDTSPLILRGYADITAPNTFLREPLGLIRESTIQPFFLSGLNAGGIAGGGGAVLEGGNFLLADSTLQGNLNPIDLSGGLLPGSDIPTSGNTINAVRILGSGGHAHWPDLGIPYRLDQGRLVSGNITIDPGVRVEGEPLATLRFVGGQRLIADGLPGSPITLTAASPGQPWQGFIFDVDADAGPRLEYCTVEGARFGVISTDNTMYVDNSIFRNNQTGANANTYGWILFGKTQFLNNAVGGAMTDLGTLELLNFTNPNSFEGNAAAIDAFEFGSDSDANLVWWGHPTGPRHPQNPGGQGDPIIGPGASGISIFPFLTERPDFADHPPVVRLLEPGVDFDSAPEEPDYFFDPGAKWILRWEAFDNAAITAQRILFSPDGHYPGRFDVLVDNLPGDLRTYELTIPDPGFAVTNSAQFIRIVAVDSSGQEGWDQTPLTVSSGRLTGAITITNASEFVGRTFFAGEEIPDLFWSGTVSGFPSYQPFIVLEADGASIGGVSIGSEGRGVFFGGFPHISTDAARLAVRVRNNSNDVEWFFAPGYFSIRHDPRLNFVPPTVQLVTPAPGASFPGGAIVPISWAASDDEGFYGFHLHASYDGGRTWHAIAGALPASARSFAWRLPASAGIPDVRVRVIARDIRFQNATSGAEAGRSFSITPGAGCAVDLTGDGVVTIQDFLAFLGLYAAGDPRADFTGDGTISIQDFLAFLSAYAAGCA